MWACGADVVRGDGHFHFESRIEKPVLHFLHVRDEFRAISQPSEAVQAEEMVAAQADVWEYGSVGVWGCHC